MITQLFKKAVAGALGVCVVANSVGSAPGQYSVPAVSPAAFQCQAVPPPDDLFLHPYLPAQASRIDRMTAALREAVAEVAPGGLGHEFGKRWKAAAVELPYTFNLLTPFPRRHHNTTVGEWASR